MSEKYLHIVTHDVPYPADFGGVIDVFYKLKALHAIGIKIKLHCFANKRPKQNILENYCESVTYYQRKTVAGISISLPYIVASRGDKRLLENLNKDNFPILFEGIHTTYHLYKKQLKDRKIFLRILNVEHIYYDHLARHEKNILKKLYYSVEAKLLKKYEGYIANRAIILALSMTDKEIFQTIFGSKSILFLPVFLPENHLTSKCGTGKYCLYHGNLTVNENEKAAIWLIENVFSKIQTALIIAGLAPSRKLKKAAKFYNNISIVTSPSNANMQLLIQNAQINILPSFNNTGLKLKLLNALYNGRHCIVNLAGVEGSGLNELCFIEETAVGFIEKINELFIKPFTTKEMQHRSTALKKLYNNEQNARIISELLP